MKTGFDCRLSATTLHFFIIMKTENHIVTRRKINRIIIHCSASRADRSLTVSDLETNHLRRGFRCIGYHYYIRRNGQVHATRPEEQVGAHTRGWNQQSIGICYEGGVAPTGQPADTRTPEQRAALRRLVQELQTRYPNASVCGHRDLSHDRNGNGEIEPEEWIKQCPCFDVATEL